MRKIVLHLHNPKTAGTSFNAILRRCFGRGFGEDWLLCGNVDYRAEHVIHAVSVMRQSAFSSHALRASSVPSQEALDPLDVAVLPISFCRDPIEKAISGYFDLRHRVGGPQHAATQMGIAEVIAQARTSDFRDTRFSISRSQTQWYFPGQPDAMAAIQAAIASRMLWLFPSHRVDEALICLEKEFPDLFPDCSYGLRKNVSPRDYDPSSEDRTALSTLPWIEQDRDLVALAELSLEGRIERLFPDSGTYQKHMKDFRGRCDVRRRQEETFSAASDNTEGVARRLINRLASVFRHRIS